MVNANFKGATHTDKNGVLHISRSKKKLENVKNIGTKFEKMFSAPTVSTVKEKARAILEEQGNTNPTKQELYDQIDIMDNAEQVIKDNVYKYKMYHNDDLKYAEDTLKTKGRRKTWNEINKIVEILSKEYSNDEIKEPENEFEQIKGVRM